MQYIRRVYNVNPGAGKYPAVSFPPELAGLLTNYVFLEPTEEGILIRPAKVEPVHSG